ncbi:class I SAM-dependent methyltransferase [Photobacterium leiognathi]|uniref:class I SAM-dependent methyltransferase n=1 Tax=Photobacterium leiognathi TaxID=553611 RepID=UPI0029823685|nr:class I SAM-dependent methyltransferase [Photobacterium leiognathi]
MSYYDTHAEAFISDTLQVDMSPVYAPFLTRFKGHTLLDLGCGSGRDLKYFSSLNLSVTGIEPSPTLARFARQYSNVDVIEQTVQSLNIGKVFDGVWACASLLHVPSCELEDAFINIVRHVNEGGLIYCSFKYGEFEGIRNGRFFTDRTLQSLQSVLPESLKIIESWITNDQRPNRDEKWLNTILMRVS